MGAPGSGALNAGYAVTYGDLGETNRMNLVNLLDRQRQERQDKIDAQKEADKAHQFALQKYYGTELDPSKYQTSTPLDQFINPAASQSLKDISDLIYKGASDEDVESAANQATSELQNMYQIGTSIKNNIATSAKGLEGDPGIDQGALQLHSNLMAFYKKDPTTGHIIPKTKEEIKQLDPQYNYAADILQNHPEWVAKDKGNVDWIGMKKLFTPSSVDVSGTHYTSPGVKSKHDAKATIYDGLQTLTKDDSGAFKVSTLSDPIITTDANGNQVKIDAIPQSTLNTLQKTPGAKANMDVATQRWLAQNYPDQPQPAPGTQHFEDMKRIMGFQMMKDFGAKAISDKTDENRSALRIRLDLGGSLPGQGKEVKDGSTPDISASFKDINGADFQSSDGKVNGTIENGVFQPAKKSLFSPLFGGGYKAGQEITGTIPVDKLPASVYKAAQSYISNNDITGETVPGTDKDGNPTSKEIPTGRVKVKIGGDGQIQAIRTDKGWFDVGDRENANVNLLNKTRSIKNKIEGKLPDAKTKKTAADYGLN